MKTAIFRNRILKAAAALLCVSLCFVLSSCSNAKHLSSGNDGAQLTVVATIFPQYDFAKNISGGTASVKMLLPMGADIHSYEPTPKDIKTIQNCDLLIYTGGENDAWIDDILKSMGKKVPATLKLIDCVSTVKEKQASGMQAEGGFLGKSSDDIDEHVWTSPKNAITITEKIKDKMCSLDTADAAKFKANAARYEARLGALDRSYTKTINASDGRTILVADRFPFRYLAEDYGLKYYAAFPGCSGTTEPNASTIAYLTKTINTKHIHYIFYTEMSNHKTADAIAEDTGAKELLLHSCHNVSSEDVNSGADYISIMEQNLKNLKKALND